MKKKIPKVIKSKSKAVKKLVVPKYTKDKKLTMLPINLEGGNVLPRGFKKYKSAVEEMIKQSPIKKGIAWLTIDEKKVKKKETHRRGGPHIDGNYIATTFMGRGDDWTATAHGRGDWKIDDPNVLDPRQHSASYDNEKGGMLIVSSYSLCKGYNGNFNGRPKTGGNCSHLSKQLAKAKSFMLKANTLYLSNSRFIHESVRSTKDIGRVLIRITLPKTHTVKI